MQAPELLAALRRATPAPARSVGDRFHESGKVSLARQDDDGTQFAVAAGGSRFLVWLWPEDAEWECDCEAPSEGCAHAWAALQALHAGIDSLPEAEAAPELAVRLFRDERFLRIELGVRRGHDLQPVESLPAGVELTEDLRRLFRLRRDWIGHRMPARLNSQLLVALASVDTVLLDEQPIATSRSPLDQQVLVQTADDGFRLSLVDPSEVTDVFEGDPTLVLGDGVLRPRGAGRLSELQRHQLRHPLRFAAHELPQLTAEWLPALQKAGLTVLRDEDVPEARPSGLHAIVQVERRGPVLEAMARLVYGDPPVAEVRDGRLLPLGGVRALPPRDERRERDLLLQFDRLALRPGRLLRFEGADAARFVRDRLDQFQGTVLGDGAAAFRVQGGMKPSVAWKRDGLQVSFTAGEKLVGAQRVLDAWHGGESLVALPGGGYAQLPLDFLEKHGDAVEGAAAGSGRHQAPLARRLLEAVGASPPPDLSELVLSLEGGVAEQAPPEGLRAELRPYQRTGFSWLAFLAQHELGGVLADDMGLGKTLQTLAVLLSRKEQGLAIVVAPTSLLANWRKEAARFTPELRVGVLHGPRRERVFADAGSYDVLVTSYALLRLDKARLKSLKPATLVLDEAQAIKNADSQTAKAARALPARWRLALSGTPVENRLGELWSLFEFLNPGFFGSKRRFDEVLGGPASVGNPRAVSALRARIRPFVLRRRKAEVAQDLPPRTEAVVPCFMTEAQQRAYDRARRNARQRVRGNRIAILAALTRLRQAACDASLLPDQDGMHEPSGKLDLLLERLVDVAEQDSRALVFSQWTSLLDRVEPRLEAAGLGYVRLDGSTRDRAAVVDRFQAPDGPPVFLISLKAGGTGLNLTAADHVFHLDPWWNPAAEQQATDRAHRIGQDKPVFVWKLVSEGTVEERVLALQERKRALADAVVEGQDGAVALSDDELLDLMEDI